MNVILSILKILLGIIKFIFIVLLILLLVIVIILAIVLLTPFKYRLIVDTNNLKDEKKDIFVDAKVTWLFRIIKVRFKHISDKVITEVFVFGKSSESWKNFFSKFKRKKKNIKEKNKREKYDQIDNSDKILDINLEYDKTIKYEGLDYNSNIKLEKTETDFKQDRNKTKSKASKETKTSKKFKKAKKKKKAKKEKKSLKEAWEKLKSNIEIFKEYNDYLKEHHLIKRFFRTIKSIIKKAIPEIIRLEGELGLEDLALTGQIIGAIWAFNGMFEKDFNVNGNFQKEIIKIQLYIKGKFKIGSMVWPIVKYIFSWSFIKLIIKIYKDIKKNRKQAKQPNMKNQLADNA